MYLPNSAVRPTGYEAGEFIETPDANDPARVAEDPRASRSSPASAPQPGRGETTHRAS